MGAALTGTYAVEAPPLVGWPPGVGVGVGVAPTGSTVGGGARLEVCRLPIPAWFHGERRVRPRVNGVDEGHTHCVGGDGRRRIVGHIQRVVLRDPNGIRVKVLGRERRVKQ